MEVAVLGTGTIGSTVAYTLLTSGIDVRVMDTVTDVSKGHAIDATHAMAHTAHSVGTGAETGDITVFESGVDAVEGVDCIVVTASAKRPPGANQRGGRKEWLEDNLSIAETVGTWFRTTTPTPVVVVTNPLDVITHELFRQSEWPARCFLGYSLSESARIVDWLANEFDVSHEDVYCPVIGEHGEHVVPVFSRATISSQSIDLDPTDREEVLDYIREVPYTVMDLRGSAESSRWVTGRGVSLLARRVLEGGVQAPVGLATPLAGEYGYSDVTLSVPLTFDENGVDEIIEWDLSAWEREQLDEAQRSIAADILE